MAIYPPTPQYSRRDKRLLQLMANLLLQCVNGGDFGSNFPEDTIPLSDSEAEELAGLLDSLLGSREFLESVYFIEGLATQGNKNEKNLREIYLSRRKKGGRSRALASRQWSDFQQRAGFIKGTVRGAPARPMSFDHFLKMERRLFEFLEIHPRVVEIVLKLIESHVAATERLRTGSGSIAEGKVAEILRGVANVWRASGRVHVNRNLTTKTNLSAAFTIVADTTVLFTTRDWSVTGTLSAMTATTMALRSS